MDKTRPVGIGPFLKLGT
ncbi:hypothetical protein RDI58_023922 [Solanum bulbocastanum]|uniref:Uncharacterized protein n=1 Tax=Solanum bulbocastanum TaxID=147425 RepID=A0AAN8Y2G5_SOLBU